MKFEDVLKNSVEVTLKNKEDFLKIVETLTRIGVTSDEKQELYQSAHILHKQGKYYIVSFKEMFALDGKATTLSAEDISRRNKIALLLDGWGLLDIVGKDDIDTSAIATTKVKVIPFQEKKNWKLVAKYTVGKKNDSKSIV